MLIDHRLFTEVLTGKRWLPGMSCPPGRVRIGET